MPGRLTSFLSDGLGNQLFILGSSLAIASSNKLELEFDLSWFAAPQPGRSRTQDRRDPIILEYPEISERFRFRGLSRHRIANVVNRARGRLERSVSVDVDECVTLPDLPPGSRVIGHMLRPDWFAHLHQELRRLISLEPTLESECLGTIHTLRKTAGRVVAVHVRRGDRVTPGRMDGVLAPEYFLQVLQRLRANPDSVLIFSDSPEWCRNAQVFSGMRVIEEERAHVVLRLMSLADDLVLSPSTLSWWAGWLCDSESKRIVVPEPFQPASPSRWTRLVMPTWQSHPGIFLQHDHPRGE